MLSLYYLIKQTPCPLFWTFFSTVQKHTHYETHENNVINQAILGSEISKTKAINNRDVQ